MKPKICIIYNCGNPVSARSSFEECRQCRQIELRWAKRSSSDIIARQVTLKKWQDRMRRLSTQEIGKKHAKVIRKHIGGAEARTQA